MLKYAESLNQYDNKNEKIIKNIFHKISIKNVFINIIAFFLGRVIILNYLNPLGVAYYAICSRYKINKFFLITSIFLGMLTVEQKVNYFKYASSFTIFILIHYAILKKYKNIKVFMQAIVATFSVFTAGMFIAIINDFQMYYILYALLESMLVGTTVIIYSKSINIIMNNMNRTALSTEEVISLTFLLGSIIAGIIDISIKGIYLKEVVSFTLILVFGFSLGTNMGAMVGTIMAVIFIITGNNLKVDISNLCVAGMISGLFKDLGKVGSMLGFILSSIILKIFYDNSILNNLNFLETIFLSSIIFLCIPKVVFNKLEEIFANRSEFLKRQYLYKIKSNISTKLNESALTFEKLSNILRNLSPKKVMLDKKEVAKFCDDVANEACKDCNHFDKCWEKNFYNTYQAIFGILSSSETKGAINIADIPKTFHSKCLNIEKFITSTNYIYDKYKTNLFWHNKIAENRELVSEQLKEISKLINYLSKDIYKYKSFREDLNEMIRIELDRNQIVANEIVVMEDKNKRYQVEIICKEYSKKNFKSEVINIVSKCIGKKMKAVYPSEKYDINESKDYIINLIEEEKLEVLTGMTRAIKHDGTVSGDNYSFMHLKEGTFMMSLSDGMGSGEDACEESKLAIELLEQFMEVGFEKQFAIKMINSTLVLKSNREIFSTLDISQIDLYTGVTEFIKIGAVATFIKTKKGVEIIETDALPIGMVNTVDFNINKRILNEGDVIIMVSDGIIDSDVGIIKDSDWLVEEIANISTNNPKEIAEYILEIAKANTKGIANDDMTVLVSKICRKKFI